MVVVMSQLCKWWKILHLKIVLKLFETVLGVNEREVDFPTHLGFIKMFILVQTSVFCLLEHNETATENENNIEKEKSTKITADLLVWHKVQFPKWNGIVYPPHSDSYTNFVALYITSLDIGKVFGFKVFLPKRFPAAVFIHRSQRYYITSTWLQWWSCPDFNYDV